jgi:hypothetical protein
MNTRWHEDDVAGRVLDQIKRGIVRGRTISIPAVAEEGDPLGRMPGAYLWDAQKRLRRIFVRAFQHSAHLHAEAKGYSSL